MNDIQNKYFTTSEIAEICGVTKHTLFHYDEIGLLKPEFVNEKGYRFYTFHQCYLLDIINVLKKAGSSLQEIKVFFANQNASMFVELMKQKKKALDLELSRIKRMRNLLEGAIEITSSAFADLKHEPVLEMCEQEYFITTPFEHDSTHIGFAKKIRQHRKYCEEKDINHGFSLCFITYKSQFESKSAYPNFIANKLKLPIKDQHMFTKPRGLYMVLDHTGSYESLPATYLRIQEYITANGLELTGNMYEEEFNNYLTDQDPDNFVIRISVGVSPKNNPNLYFARHTI